MQPVEREKEKGVEKIKREGKEEEEGERETREERDEMGPSWSAVEPGPMLGEERWGKLRRRRRW